MRTFEEKIITWLLVTLPGLIALFVFPFVVRCFDFSKSIFFNILVIGAFCIGYINLLRRKNIKINEARFKSGASKIVFGILLVAFLATIFSEQHLNSIWGSYERGLGLIAWLFFIAYFLLLLIFLEKKLIKRALEIVIWTGGIVGLYGLLQHFGIDPIFKDFDTDFLEGRIFSLLGNPDFLAQFLAPLIMMGILFIKEHKKYLLIPTSIMLWALVYTESRASFLALIVVFVFWIFLSIKNKKIFLITLSSFIAIFILLVSFKLPLFGRFNLNEENLRSVSSRLNIWNIAIQIIIDHPILGVGPENFEIYFPEYMTPEFYTLEDNIHISADRAHNEILDMGTMGGIPMIILYLSLIVWIFWFGIYKKPTTISKIIALTLFVIFLQNQLTFQQFTHYVLFFFLIGALVIEKTEETYKEYKPSKQFLMYGTPLVFIFLIFILSQTVVDRVYAESWYTYALATNDTKTGLKNAIGFDPTNAEFRYNLLMWYPEERTSQLEALRQIEGDTIEVMAWTANDMLSRDKEGAYALFEKAIALNPLYPHTQRAYADGLYLNGDYKKAAEHYELFLKASPEFWKWCTVLDEKSDYEKKKYRVFYKNVPDFNNSIAHLYDAYTKSGDGEKAKGLEPYIACFISR